MAGQPAPRAVAPTRLPPAGPQQDGRAPTRPPEVAPPSSAAASKPEAVLDVLGFGGSDAPAPAPAPAPVRPPEVAPPVVTMAPIYSPGDPGMPRTAPPRVAAAPARPPVGGTGGPVSDGPSVTIRIPGIPEFDVRTPTIADSPPWVPFLETPFDKQQAWRKTNRWDGQRIAPVLENAVVTSGFRLPFRPGHDGLDVFVGPRDDRRIVAPIGGFIDIDRNATGGEGCMVTIYGDDGRKYQMLHLKAGSIPAHWHTGDRVEMGELIGVMGKTGHVVAGAGGDGTHLHFQVLEPNHQPPRGPRDFHHVDPDRFYDENMRLRYRGDRSKTMLADISAPIQAGSRRELQIALTDDIRGDFRDDDRPITTALPDAPIPYQQLRPSGQGLQVADASPAEPLASPARPEPVPAKPVNLNGLF